VDANAQSNVKEIEIQAVVIRADGTREDLGQVSYWHKNPIKRLIHKVTHNGNRTS
jgi:hypothetical protein